MARMGEETKVYKVLVGKSEVWDVVEVRGVDRMMRPECILGRMTGGWGVEWIRLAQDMDQWRALMNTVMNIRVLAP
jgi:hypothetical protein